MNIDGFGDFFALKESLTKLDDVIDKSLVDEKRRE